MRAAAHLRNPPLIGCIVLGALAGHCDQRRRGREVGDAKRSPADCEPHHRLDGEGLVVPGQAPRATREANQRS